MNIYFQISRKEININGIFKLLIYSCFILYNPYFLISFPFFNLINRSLGANFITPKSYHERHYSNVKRLRTFCTCCNVNLYFLFSFIGKFSLSTKANFCRLPLFNPNVKNNVKLVLLVRWKFSNKKPKTQMFSLIALIGIFWLTASMHNFC